MSGPCYSTIVQTFLRETYLSPGGKGKLPDVCFYDMACVLLKRIRSRTEDHDLLKVVFPVDDFHIKSHDVKDDFCQKHCNPRAFPQLRDENDRPIFNSSAAELTNLWFGRFYSICRGMRIAFFEFFLDEMVVLYNFFWRRSSQRRRKILLICQNPILVPASSHFIF